MEASLAWIPGAPTRCSVVQCSVPDTPHTTSQGGTTFGDHCNVMAEVGYSVTGLGGDERIQTILRAWKRVL